MFTLRTLLEGKWPILVTAALTGATLAWCPVWWASVLPVALLAFVLAFFRDPGRVPPKEPAAVVAPADGTVSDIIGVEEQLFMAGKATRVGIFLSVFDVHVQRAPIDGEVKFVKYVAGKFVDARREDCSLLNEHRIVGIERDDGLRVVVRQIAGLIARRIVGWADEGARLTKGERIGMIRFGSRVELFLPTRAEITVEVGQHVKGGKTIVARIK